MKKDRLKPYVYKVEGAVNFAFYDILHGQFYQFTPDGTIVELRKYLLEEGLIFETEGIVPNKLIMLELWDIQHKINIRVLQIRLNGVGEDNCWNRLKKEVKKQYMKKEILKKIISEFEYIPLHKIEIEAEENDREKIEMILNEFKFKVMELNIKNRLDKKDLDNYKEICSARDIEFSNPVKKNVKELKIEIINFLYTEFYNPCLGHQIAIDTGGEIKCCLWSDDVLGNIVSDNLKDMIVSGTFDNYWEISKEKIDSCKDCELRFACDDCRVFALVDSGRLESKPSYCNYDPYTGQGSL